jgi:hypothetical protein
MPTVRTSLACAFVPSLAHATAIQQTSGAPPKLVAGLLEAIHRLAIGNRGRQPIDVDASRLPW